MKKLIARCNILFESKMFAPGEELPTYNTVMVEAWIEARTAYWKETKDIVEEIMSQFDTETGEKVTVKADEETEETETTPVIATPAAAEAGLSGEAVNSNSANGEDLVGKIPESEGKKVGRKIGRK